MSERCDVYGCSLPALLSLPLRLSVTCGQLGTLYYVRQRRTDTPTRVTSRVAYHGRRGTAYLCLEHARGFGATQLQLDEAVELLELYGAA